MTTAGRKSRTAFFHGPIPGARVSGRDICSKNAILIQRRSTKTTVSTTNAGLMKAIPFVLCLLLFVACALDRPPSGGPPDTEPLLVTAADPKPSSVNITPERIRFTFNRYVATSALRRSIVFSPTIGGYSLKADGTEAEIVFGRPFESGKTYTVTLNKSLRSSRGNELEQSYTYAFSTGPEINRGSISGKVFTEDARPAAGATVLAYALPPENGSNVDPPGEAADYSVQTGRDGSFTLDYLAEGTYRLVALLDGNRDLKLDRAGESFGVGTRARVETGSQNNLFRLAAPRGAPLLRYCSAPADNLLEISFDRAVSLDRFSALSIAVLDTTLGVPVPVLGFYSTKNAMEDITFRLVTGKLDKNSAYRITGSSPSGRTSSVVCRGSGRDEREKLRIAELKPADGEKRAFLSPPVEGLDKAALIAFNVPVDLSSLRKSVRLYEVNGAAAKAHGFSVRPIDARRFALQAEPAFRDSASYRIEIAAAGLRGTGGETAADSVAAATFTVAGADAFGEITGRIVGAEGTVVVEAVNTRTRRSKTSVVSSPGGEEMPYRITNLAPGEYIVSAYIPRADGDGARLPSWNPGDLEPFEPADPFTVSPEAVTVRKGWATENVMLEF